MTPINLLCLTTYTGMGGGETSLLTLAEHLDPARITPHLLTPRGGQLPDRWRANGWPTHHTPYRGASTYFVPALYARFPIVNRFIALLREQKIDVLHSDYHTLPFAIAAGRRAHILVVWTCWGWWFHPKRWQRAFFAQPDHTFAASGAIRDGFLGDPPFMPPDRVEVLPPGVDTDRFRPGVDGTVIRVETDIAPDAPLVALIARFQDVKGHDVFLEMARRVLQAIPEARFVVAGENVHGASADDAYKARILAMWRADPLLSRAVTYLGFRADAERVIAAADVIAVTSHFESYGMVGVEAMASGKPIVSTRRGGPSETIADGVTGVLCDPGDAEGLAAAAIGLLRDPAGRAAMGAAGRARVLAGFAAPAMAARFTDRLEKIKSQTQRHEGTKAQRS